MSTEVIITIINFKLIFNNAIIMYVTTGTASRSQQFTVIQMPKRDI